MRRPRALKCISKPWEQTPTSWRCGSMPFWKAGWKHDAVVADLHSAAWHKQPGDLRLRPSRDEFYCKKRASPRFRAIMAKRVDSRLDGLDRSVVVQTLQSNVPPLQTGPQALDPEHPEQDVRGENGGMTTDGYRIPTFAFHINGWKRMVFKSFFPERRFAYLPLHITTEAFAERWMPRITATEGAEIFIWGQNVPANLEAFVRGTGIPCYFIEDGFLRSNRPNAARTPPLSLALDSRASLFRQPGAFRSRGSSRNP